jgi:ribonuclease J
MTADHREYGLRLIVHRAANSIGGNCIELCTRGGSRILLDVGRPLDALPGATGLLPMTLDQSSSVDGILISHPHQDHYGLAPETPTSWPVYCGEATGKLMRITAEITWQPLLRELRHWHQGKSMQIGDFSVRPILIDHSAFDAYMLLIEACGKRILYSGDFRRHGRKANLVQRLMDHPPNGIDVLLMEGTNLGSDKPCITESEVEAVFLELFRATPGRVFVAWSAQNIDRIVTLYRACRRAGRTLVVDLYTADVLRVVAAYGQIPQPGWPNLKVFISRSFARLYRRKGRADFVDQMAQHGISAKHLAQSQGWVSMIRPSLMRDLADGGVQPTSADTWSFSMWRGYLQNAKGERLRDWFAAAGAGTRHIHTSGHASAADLRKFAQAIAPKTLVPIHGLAWDSEAVGFPHITRLTDGQPLEL